MTTHIQSLAKAFSWRFLATATTIIISFFITNNIGFAFTIGVIEFLLKIILYYAHERFWIDFLPMFKKKLQALRAIDD